MKKLIPSLLALLFMALMSGCSYKVSQVNPNLPTINSLKTISDMTQIAFEWNPVNDESIAGYYLYRSNPNDDGKMSVVANIKDRFATHYVDTNLAPSTEYRYELRSYDNNGDISNNGEVITASTSKLIESVSFAQAIYGLPNRIKILWRPHPDPRVASYIIERNNISSDKWYRIAEVKGRLNVEYIDDGLDPNHHYRYRILVKTVDGITSGPSAIISAQTKALPNLVLNLQATTNLPKKITLTWEPNTNEDFSHYNIYRSSNEIFPLLKLAQTTAVQYDDLINENGAQMYYKVTAVDKDGLESPKQNNSVVGNTLTSPKSPIITGASFNGISIELSWNPGSDNRSVKYKILKSSAAGEEAIDDVAGNSYNDDQIQLGLEYTYKIVGIDEYGINSNESKQAIVVAK
ncbi:fibronectin [Campylobacter fetus subsp. testudinum]|uniref:fibronectin type III domain-containing protein n=1 Tax=Campylobacter fetus TaxID=196 RepID=UPI0008187A54|nr:fibronectin type III domain-containing protein [Campylobacter fetus]MPB72517.1 fibronectin type III domain-containing protein [Campylobacter fetus]MPB77219.1 fibronectin type III domain-containing protein [Campylobacter fetus]OCR86842.1 fibronectin [Campylobacter fetus subsp. testudinum]OCR88859.1 fibronectin [Campylobacter fetus subsp. testudinum]